MIELCRDYHFEAAHFLPNVPAGHKCGNMHGHSYQVTILVQGEIGQPSGWLMDFSDIDVFVKPVIERLDHKTLNEVPGLQNPTSELLAVWLFETIKPMLPILAAVTVSETKTSRCIYRG